ncbi:DNA mismatch repair endonuclease MutL [Urechidicola vernalis]|uniref:DNA mismatch repair protein MutL n=1 Tax=Urechidicola vernalis TaxID=3075600 RepID=A0ABU2Y1U9_9FLAO|nr:DNA mismatch repair endonuclease MutL [Urechidicola sp. P050]MDT0552183.1 DNA mismatch repair endonuclease MutL [Urechidicola sp. P050]
MSDIIQLLPDHVANQIAAGEVVQRPASVVKELLENSIDAGATNIKLLLKDAGKALIQVIDNGKGMSETDARLSFERHATSKIRTAEDLFNLQTKGFRGEALASIAAIAHIELKTKLDLQELGTHIKIEGSEITLQEVVSTPTGTSLSVKNLFYNIPARRNFLKSNQVETRHIIDEFQRVALVHPTISFSLYHNDNEVYRLNASNLRQRIVAILGKKTNERLVPVNEDTDVVQLTGFVTKPEFVKKKRGEQFFFVNDRFIKNSYLNHAVNSAFEDLILPGNYPSYFLYLTVPPNTIDINIHPTKTEVKFDNEKVLYAIIRATVKHSLGQYNVSPVLDFNRDAGLDTPYNFKDKKVSKAPQITIDRDFNPFKSDEQKSISFPYKREQKQDWESLYVDIKTPEIDIKNIEVQSELIETELFDAKESISKTHQIHRKYIVSSIKSGIVFINQNLAHQRILYEEYLTHITVNDAMSQQLLFPLDINLSKDDILLIKELRSDIESTGFLFDKIEDEKIVVSGIPVAINESQVISVLEQLLEDIKNEIPETSFSQIDIMAKSMAKSLAIKNGKTLNVEEQESLVEDLFSCKEPNHSPFGRPTFISMELNEIDKKFDL